MSQPEAEDLPLRIRRKPSFMPKQAPSFWRQLRKMTGNPTLVGRHDVLSEIGQVLRQGGLVSRILICGMPGIGKTALMKAAAASVAREFGPVIWVTVGRCWDVRRIQEDIRSQLGPSSASPMISEMALQEKLPETLSLPDKWLLVLDDIHSVKDLRHNLSRVGIPFYTFGVSMIVLITRYLNLFSFEFDWFIRTIELRFLDVEESWELFRRELGGEVDLDHPSIRPLAATLVDKCGGLPLALIKVAKAMAHATTALQWEHAMRTLKEFPGLLPGIEDFLINLKSDHFDRLSSETTKQCLLYCSLFPEDHSITEDQLRELWVTKGLIVDDPNSHLDEISDIIEELVDECLLILDGYGRVKMHNVVRMMIYWLTSGVGRRHRQSDSRGAAEEEFDVTDQTDVWRDAHRFHLLMNRSGVREGPGDMPADENTFPHLLYLLLCNRKLSYSFLSHSLVRTPALQFLNLSGANVVGGELLPPEIGLLVGLRHLNLSGTAVGQLPAEIGSLANLEHLDLSRTGIKELPEALGKLTRLRHLLLRETRSLSSIPDGTIENLRRLRTLDFFRSSFRRIKWLDLTLCLPAMERLGMSLAGDVDGLEALDYPNFTVPTRFVRAVRCLELSQLGGFTVKQLSDYLSQLWELRELDIVGPCCSESQELELKLLLSYSLCNLRLSTLRQTGIYISGARIVNLRELRIDHCHGLRKLSWFNEFNSLQYIGLADCSGLEELMWDDDTFPCLKKMSLRWLPRLRIISWGPLNPRRLVELEVRGCPELTALPFDKRAATTVRRVIGEQEWWDKLEFPWEMSAKAALGCCFHPLTPAPANASDSPFAEQGEEEHHDDGVGFLKNDEENAEEIEIIQLEEDAISEETDLTSFSPLRRSPRREHDGGVGFLKNKAKEKLEEAESSLPQQDRELVVSRGTVGEEIGRTTRSPAVDEIAFPPSTSGGGMEKLHEGEDSSLTGQDWDNQDDKEVMENLEEEGTDSGSRQDGSLRLQEGEESVSQEGCSKQTALETMDDGEKHRSITDGLVDVESHKEIVSKVRDCLQADKTRVIGILGTGGAGKTTLLKMISVEFCNKQDSGFDVVIVATSSKHNQHKKKVQREIGEQLGLSLLASGPPFLENLQAAVLRQALSQKKFLLILDGVQEMDWDRIGIPLLNKIHKSKIVFATDAFEGMENVEVVKMNGLNESESWELFLRNVKDEAVCKDESIKLLAKQIVAKCDGLPLALILVGRALADKKAPQDWQHAIHKMDFLTKGA